jgi:hypothetical protein
VRITVRTFAAVDCLRSELDDFWVTVTGRELVVSTIERSFSDGLALILEAIHRCLEETGIGPVSLEVDGERYTMYATSEK